MNQKIGVLMVSPNDMMMANTGSAEKCGMSSVSDPRKYTKASLTKTQIAALLARLSDAMLQDRLYLDNMLSLSRLAECTGGRAHDLSQVLNQVVGKGFFDYINGFRINTAIELLKDPNGLSMFDIAMESGFNSKSTFYAAFKKHTHMTPYQYKSRALVVHPEG